jgi:hypothetical protein
MSQIRLVAAALAACTTFVLLSTVVSFAEPQRSSLHARLHPAQARASQVVVRPDSTRAIDPSPREAAAPVSQEDL